MCECFTLYFSDEIFKWKVEADIFSVLQVITSTI